MKIFTRICLMICAVCVGIGIVCFCAGLGLGSGVEEVMAMADAGALDIGRWHIGNWEFYYDPFEELEDIGLANIKKGALTGSVSADQVSNLDLDIKYGAISLVDSDTDEITVTVDAPKRNSYVYEHKNGTLRLEDRTPRRYWRGGTRHDVKVTIKIPAGKFFEKVDLDTDYGMIDVDHMISAGEVDITLGAGELKAEKVTAESEFSVDVGAGDLEVDQFEAEKLEISCGVGKAELNGKVRKDVDADCGVGQIRLELTGNEKDYDYNVDCGLGVTSINGKEYSALSDDIEIDNHAGKEINLECGIGEIVLTVEEE